MLPPPRIAVHGHRGARAVLPENTIPGFIYAIRAGVDFIEMDLAVTSDDVLVVSHDPVLRRRVLGPAGYSRTVRELNFEQLQLWDCGSRTNLRFPRQCAAPGARIPSLEEVLALAPLGSFQFNIEVKSYPERPWLTPPPERLATLLLEAIDRHRLASRIMLQSFDLRVLRAMARYAPGMPLSALDEFGARNFLRLARDAGTHIVGPYHRLVTRRRVLRAHKAGIRVVPWTANRPREWLHLIRAGVDGIITDDPGALIAYLQSLGLRPVS